jgi:hypothetical protein
MHVNNINTHNLRISPEFFNASLSREPNSTRPLDRRTAHLLRHDARPPLGHRRLFGEA